MKLLKEKIIKDIKVASIKILIKIYRYTCEHSQTNNLSFIFVRKEEQSKLKACRRQEVNKDQSKNQ